VASLFWSELCTHRAEIAAIPERHSITDRLRKVVFLAARLIGPNDMEGLLSLSAHLLEKADSVRNFHALCGFLAMGNPRIEIGGDCVCSACLPEKLGCWENTVSSGYPGFCEGVNFSRVVLFVLRLLIGHQRITACRSKLQLFRCEAGLQSQWQNLVLDNVLVDFFQRFGITTFRFRVGL